MLKILSTFHFSCIIMTTDHTELKSRFQYKNNMTLLFAVIRGSHFFGLTNFPHFSRILFHFPSILKVHFQYDTLFPQFNFSDCQISPTFPVSIPTFQCKNFPMFSIFWVEFPDFSSLIEIRRLFLDQKMVSRFSKFSSTGWNHEYNHIQ